MPEFRIFETEEYTSGLTNLPEPVRNHVQKNLDDFAFPLLREQPFLGGNIPRLRDYSPKVWLYKIGPCRIFYTVDEDRHVVSLLAIVSY